MNKPSLLALALAALPMIALTARADDAVQCFVTSTCVEKTTPCNEFDTRTGNGDSDYYSSHAFVTLSVSKTCVASSGKYDIVEQDVHEIDSSLNSIYPSDADSSCAAEVASFTSAYDPCHPAPQPSPSPTP